VPKPGGLKEPAAARLKIAEADSKLVEPDSISTKRHNQLSARTDIRNSHKVYYGISLYPIGSDV
jgi:hypothetical protein